MHHLVGHTYTDLTAAVVVPVASLAYLAWVDWRLTLLTLVPIAGGLAAYAGAMSGSRDKYATYDASLARLAAGSVEFAPGIAVVRTFGQAGRAHRRFITAADDFARFFTAWVRGVFRASGTLELLMAPVFMLLWVLAAGTAFVAAGWLPAVDLLAFAVLTSGLTAPWLALGYSAESMRSAGQAATRIGELLATPVLPEPEEPRAPEGSVVELDDVSYSYDGRTAAVDGVSLTMAPGTVTALVGPSGSDARLSGGEAQRVSIARALLADTPILVLDEATAFADPESEAAIQDALSALAAGRTLLVIAHRPSTIVEADQILVMDAGRIVEHGRHPDLVASGGAYARAWAAHERASRLVRTSGTDSDSAHVAAHHPADRWCGPRGRRRGGRRGGPGRRVRAAPAGAAGLPAHHRRLRPARRRAGRAARRRPPAAAAGRPGLHGLRPRPPARLHDRAARRHLPGPRRHRRDRRAGRPARPRGPLRRTAGRGGRRRRRDPDGVQRPRPHPGRHRHAAPARAGPARRARRAGRGARRRDLRLRAGSPRPVGCQPLGAAADHDGAGRAVRRRQDHGRAAGRPVLGRGLRRRPGGGRGRPRPHDRAAHGPGVPGLPGRLPVRRHHRRERPAGAARRHRRPAGRGGPARPGGRDPRPAARRLGHPRRRGRHVAVRWGAPAGVDRPGDPQGRADRAKRSASRREADPWSASLEGRGQATRAIAPSGGSATAPGCRAAAIASTPSTRRGPGRTTRASASTAHTSAPGHHGTTVRACSTASSR